MKNEKASAGIVILIVVIIIGLGVGSYFIFFNMSETKAKKIISEDFNNNPSEVCNKFYIQGDSDRCPGFMDCYVEKAINAMSKPLLIQFAKDIKKGKSSAVDSYSLINGKGIGEDCISEILDIPENVNLNLVGN